MKSTDETKPWRFIISRPGLFFSVLSGAVLLGGVTGVNRGMVYAQEQLTPRLAQQLSETIDRPVQLGVVERVSLTGIRLGTSTIPPTATDRNQMEIDAIEVGFNGWELLTQRRMKLTVTLVQPRIFLEQDETGNWLKTDLRRTTNDFIDLERVRLRNATIELIPRSKPMRSLVDNPEAQGIPVASPQTVFQQVNLTATQPDGNASIQFALRGKAAAGGGFSLRGQADLQQQQVLLRVRCHQLAATALNPFLPPSARLDAGTLTSRVQLQLQPDRTPLLWGTAQFYQVAAQVRREPNLLTQMNGRLRFQGTQTTVQSATLNYGQIPIAQVTGTIDVQEGLDLRARVEEAGVAEVLQTFKLNVPFTVGGSIRADDLRVTGPLKAAVFSGTAHHHQLIQADRLQSQFQGRLSFNTATRHLTFHDLQFSPTMGGRIAARGEVRVGKAAKGEPDDLDLMIEVEDLSADQIALLYDLPLPTTIGALNARAKLQVLDETPALQGNWQLSQGTFPAQGTFALEGGRLRFRETDIQSETGIQDGKREANLGHWQFVAESQQIPLSPVLGQPQLEGRLDLTGDFHRPIESAQGTLQARLQAAAGTVQVQGEFAQGQWQAVIQSTDWDITSLLPDRAGVLTGEVNLAGSLTEFSSETIQAAGQLQLSDGFASGMGILNQPLNASFHWDAGKLHIQQLSMAGLEARGWVTCHFMDQFPQITEVNLDVNLEEYDLQTLPLSDLPISVEGIVNFQGQVTGTPTLPQLEGTIQLQNFVLDRFPFEPDLRGHLTVTADRQLVLDLVGNHDRIALVLDEQQGLETLTVELDQASLQVVPAVAPLSSQYPLVATLENFPLTTLNLSPFEAFGTVNGILSGQFALNLTDLTNPHLAGTVAIDRLTIDPKYAYSDAGTNSNEPSVSNSEAYIDRFTGTIQYSDRILALTEGTLHLGTGEYHLTSQIQLPIHPVVWPQFTAHLSTTSGDLAELHARIPDYTWEPLLAVLPTDSLNQLMSPLPVPLSSPVPTNLRTLLPQHGQFSTQIALHHSPQTGLSVAFDLQGEDWTWQDYRVRQVQITEGHFDGTSLSLSPVLLHGLVYQPIDRPSQSYSTRLSFSGQMGQGHTAELQAKAIPVALVGHLLNLPIPLAGLAEGTFTLTGDVFNPDITGTIALLNLRLNQREIRDLQIDFSYRNRQFRLQDWTVMD